MHDQSRQSRINHDTARMWVDIIRKTLRGETINAETRAEQACGHWMQRTARRKASVLRGNWAMTPSDYYSRHERRPAWQRTDTWWTVGIVVGLFVAGAVAGAITQ